MKNTTSTAKSDEFIKKVAELAAEYGFEQHIVATINNSDESSDSNGVIAGQFSAVFGSYVMKRLFDSLPLPIRIPTLLSILESAEGSNVNPLINTFDSKQATA